MNLRDKLRGAAEAPAATEDRLSAAWAKRFGARAQPITRDDPPEDGAPPAEPPLLAPHRARAASGHRITYRRKLVLARVPDAATDEATLPFPARVLLSFVGAETTVRKVIDASGLDQDLAYGALRDLVSRGLLRCFSVDDGSSFATCETVREMPATGEGDP